METKQEIKYYSKSEVKILLKKQIKRCEDIARLNWGGHIGDAISKVDVLPFF